MPKIERWDHFPEAVRQHLVERMRDRAIGIADLNKLRLWIEARPEVPEGDWYKDFGSFKICGSGALPRPSCFEGKPRKAQSSNSADPIRRLREHDHQPACSQSLKEVVELLLLSDRRVRSVPRNHLGLLR